MPDKRALIEKSLLDTKALPAGPMVINKIEELCRDHGASARDLGKVLQLDPALTTRVLKQVNSSFYGLSATIKTVTHAVVILGFQEIKNLAFSVPVANLYQEHFNQPGINVELLWDRTLRTACLARALSYHIKYEVPEQIFVSGILCKCGMVVLNSILKEEYAKVVDSCPDEEFLPEVEEAELGISHVEIGRRLAEKWHFPPTLISAIGNQYDPVKDGQILTEPALVYAARVSMNTLYNRQPSGNTELMTLLPEEIVVGFKLSPEILFQSFEKAITDFDQARRMLAAE
jgi:HD-like signal output (HDOD) protein